MESVIEPIGDAIPIIYRVFHQPNTFEIKPRVAYGDHGKSTAHTIIPSW